MKKYKSNPAIGKEKSGYSQAGYVSSFFKIPRESVKFLGRGINSEETYIVYLPNGRFIFKLVNLSDSEINRLKYLSELDLIPKIYKISSEYYLMKFIDGSNIDDLIKDTKPDLALKRYILEKTKKELDKWHELGIYHGDFAPRNIFLSKTGRIYLIDPWLSKEILNTEHEIKKDKDYFKIFANKMLAAVIRGRGYLKKNPMTRTWQRAVRDLKIEDEQ